MRRIFLINKKFQLRFSLFVCSWIIGLSLIYPFVIRELFEQVLHFAAKDPMGPSMAVLEERRSQFMTLLIAAESVFIGMTFLIMIFVSHRIAGPLYKLSRFFKEAGAGNLREELRFRKHDHFKNLADEYNQMIKGLRGLFDQNRGSAEAAIARIEHAIQHTDAVARIDLEQALASLHEISGRIRLPESDPLPRRPNSDISGIS